MMRIVSAFVFMIYLACMTSAQELGEMEYEAVDATNIIVTDPESALLLIESTVPGLQFKSRGGIKNVTEKSEGIWHIVVNKGVHRVVVSSAGYLPLDLPRITLQSKQVKKFRIRAKPKFGAADVAQANRPELRLLYNNVEDDQDVYVKIDDNPPQKVDFSEGYITLRPDAGDRVVTVFKGGSQWSKQLSLIARQSYEEQVVMDVSNSGSFLFAQSGNIFVESNPPGATVFLNQIEQTETTPTTISDIQPGMYEVVLMLPQYKPETRQIEVKSLEYSELNVELVPNYTQLLIDSDPTGAALYLNEEQVGVTPYKARKDVGTYVVKIVMPFYHDVADTVSLSVGTTVDSTYSLDPRFGELTLTSDPEGAEVLLDGNVMGVTPLTIERVPSGTHLLELNHQFYATIRQEVDVVDGGQETLFIDLRSTVGKLNVETEPAGAKVRFVDQENKVIGLTPVSDFELPAGSYMLSVEKVGFNGLEVPVVIRKGQTETVSVPLVRSSGIMRVESTPPRATIFIGEENYGETPEIIRDLPTDVYDVRVELEGYDPHLAQVRVLRDTISDHRITLSKAGQIAQAKRRKLAILSSFVPSFGIGQLISPGQRVRGLLYAVTMGAGVSVGIQRNAAYDTELNKYQSTLSSYQRAEKQSGIDALRERAISLKGKLEDHSNKRKQAAIGVGIVYAVQLLDALLFGGGDVVPTSAKIQYSINPSRHNYLLHELKWTF